MVSNSTYYWLSVSTKSTLYLWAQCTHYHLGHRRSISSPLDHSSLCNMFNHYDYVYSYIYILYFIYAFLLLLFHLMISLGILFIYKLITVYRNGCIASNDVYVCAITRTTILCSISISMSFVAIIGCTFYHLDTSNHTAVWLTRFLTLADVYSNTLCVVMCYKCFLPIYDKLCIHLDAMCRRCWIKIVRDDTRDIKVQTDCDFTEDKTTNTVTTTDRIFMHETTV
eukprot:233882_1